MELFQKLFGELLLFVYHCFDRMVINGYLCGLSRPEQVVHFFRQVIGVPILSKEMLAQRTSDYHNWVEAFAGNPKIPIQWSEKGVRKEDYVLPWLRRMRKKGAYGVYFIFKSMEQGPTFRISVPKYPTKDPNHRILAPQRSRFTHFYFYIYDQVLGPMVMRVASFLPFQATYYLNGHSFIEQELKKAQVAFRKNDNCRNFIFKRNFPIHKIFERSCEIGLWRLTANRISELFGVRLHKRMGGKLGTVIDQIEHGHHVFRAYWKNAFLKQYEKFSTLLRNELCSNNLSDFALKKGLQNLNAVRTKFLAITDRFAGLQAQWLNVHVDFPLLQRMALPIVTGSVYYAGIKIHETRIIRLLEVFLHAGNNLGGWSAKHIHQVILQSFQISEKSYGLNQLRYDLRKLKGHGLLERDGSRYAYRLTSKGFQVALLFLFFHKRLCGPLANSRFHHQPDADHRPKSKLEAAYYKADRAIQDIVNLLDAA